jgi:DNA-binding NarL/FixJ family response regulator
MVLEGLLRAEVEIIEANCIDTALAQLEKPMRIDLALVDLNMNGSLSLNVLKEVRDIYPDTRFVIISASEARSDVFRALDAGLLGFIC